jgi:hypothetical protein
MLQELPVSVLAKKAEEKRPSNIKHHYARLAAERQPFLTRAWKCSKYSIPALIPEFRTGEDLYVPFQTLAARGVNNLASKLMMTLLPPNTPFFKLRANYAKLSAEEQADKELLAELDRGLSKVELAILEDIAGTNDRTVLFEALRHLLVGGNALLFLNPQGDTRCFHLDQYVVRRGGNGEVKELIVREEIPYGSLPDSTRTLIEQGEDANTHGPDHKCELYTCVKRAPTRWEAFQEVEGVLVEGSRGTYPIDASPWIPMRLMRVSGEAYGRSFLDDYYGDIVTLDSLAEAIVQGSAAAARVLFLIHPNSVLKDTDLADTPNLGFTIGSKDDVDVLQLEKFADFRIAQETMRDIQHRLEQAFILYSSIQRDAERVTKEEIQRMTEELETALGGVYSMLAVEFQNPYIACRMKQLQQKGSIPALPKGIVKPIIVTGVEALGRGNDKDRLIEFMTHIVNFAGPEALPKFLNLEEIIQRLGTSMGIDLDGLTTDQEQVKAEQAQQMQMQQMQENIGALGPDLIKQAGSMIQGGNLQVPGIQSTPDIQAQMIGGMM